MPAFDVPANLAFENYTELVAAIESWMDRTDLSGSVQAMIALAEARMRRELTPLFMETSITIVTADGYGGLPTDFSTANRVEYDGDTLPAYSSVGGNTIPASSTPFGYSLEKNQLRVWPDGDWTVTLYYQPTIPYLSEGSPTNDLLSLHPDAYFYGAMLFAEGFVANDSRASVFKALWDECLAEMKVHLTRQRLGGPLVPRVAFVP